LEELGTERATRALLAADGSLHDLDVAITPFLQSLIEISHQLEKDAQVGPLAIQDQQRFQIRLGPIRSDSLNAEELMKRIIDRGLLQPPLEVCEDFGIVFMKAEHLGPAIAKQELQLAKLNALKARRRFEPGAEAIERQ